MRAVPSEQYVGRPRDSVPVNFSLPRDAVRLLHELAPTKKSIGRFIGELIYEFHKRKEFQAFYEEETTRQHKKLARLLRQTARAMATRD